MYTRYVLTDSAADRTCFHAHTAQANDEHVTASHSSLGIVAQHVQLRSSGHNEHMLTRVDRDKGPTADLSAVQGLVNGHGKNLAGSRQSV